MKQTIIDLWNGNIAPVEHCGSHNGEVNELVSLMERHRNTLNGGLTEAQKETFQKYMDCADEYLLHMLELAFYDGFSIGASLVVEALQ